MGHILADAKILVRQPPSGQDSDSEQTEMAEEPYFVGQSKREDTGCWLVFCSVLTRISRCRSGQTRNPINCNISDCVRRMLVPTMFGCSFLTRASPAVVRCLD
jgi:hypothetical protein